jgi:ssDNA-binding Zn-finger/Zn-ribbon topoisomerase 1
MRKITMPKCPHCGKEKEYRIGDYDTSKLVSMIMGTGGSNVAVRCEECGKDYEVSCNIRFYGRR